VDGYIYVSAWLGTTQGSQRQEVVGLMVVVVVVVWCLPGQWQ
jgi:hypothetical protein